MPVLDSIKASENIVIVPQKFPSVSEILSTKAFLRILNSQKQKARLFLNLEGQPSEFQSILEDSKQYITKNLRAKDFSAFLGSESGVEDVKVSKEKEGFKLIFKTADGDLNLSGLELTPISQNIDLLFYLGSEQLEYPLKVQDDSNEINEQYLESDISNAIGLSMANLCFELFNNNIDKDSATLLLAAILYEEWNARTSKIYETINRLLFKHKASFSDAEEFLKKFDYSSLDKWQNEILENIQITDELAYAVSQGNFISPKELLLAPLSTKLAFFSSVEDKDKLIITKVDKQTILIGEGKIIQKFNDFKIRYVNTNRGIVTIIVDDDIANVLQSLELSNEKKKTSKELNKSDEEKTKNEQKDEKKETVPFVMNNGKKENKQVQNSEQSDQQTEKQKQKSKEKNREGEETKVSQKQVEQSRNTSVLNQQKSNKVTVENRSEQQNKSQKSKQVSDPLPKADWQS